MSKNTGRKSGRNIRKTGELIKQKKVRLRDRIASDLLLQRDFDYLVNRTGWSEEALLSRLFWDCNMMSADARSLLAREKRQTWPIGQSEFHKAIENIREIAHRIEQINQTELSPARTVFFYDGEGVMVTRQEAKRTQNLYLAIPDTLRAYGMELKRKVSIHVSFWRHHALQMPSLVQMVREHSLYEKIRSTTGGYHQTRLHRLVNAARIDQGLPPIEQRAFTIWLNRLKKRRQSSGRPKAPSPSK
jgi:hypothetical protein